MSSIFARLALFQLSICCCIIQCCCSHLLHRGLYFLVPLSTQGAVTHEGAPSQRNHDATAGRNLGCRCFVRYLLSLAGLVQMCILLKLPSVTVVTAQNCNGTVSTVEISALQDFYDATNGPNWDWYKVGDNVDEIWNFSYNPQPCTVPWYGIRCQKIAGLCTITSLKLNNFSLSGTLTSSLRNLTGLENLNLHRNQLRGHIPSSLGQLTNLTIFNVHHNLLSGQIPSSLKKLTELTQLLLFRNQLSGPVPSVLSQLTKLESLMLDHNLLSGAIPSSLSQLTKLVDLYLNDNILSGPIPSSLNQLSNLVGLFIYRNRLSGSIPSSLGNLTTLLYFFLNYNQLSGTIPSSLDQLAKIQKLKINNNQLTGPISSSLSRLTNCDSLDLSNNYFSGTVPNFGASIVYLSLSYNMLSGSVPFWNFEKSLNLTIVILDHNILSGTLSNAISKAIHLNTFLLQNNHLSGNLDKIFSPANNTQLATIELSNNKFTGTIPSEIFYLPRLAVFAAVSNCLRGPLPHASICSSTSLQSLLLDGLHTAPACQSPIFSRINTPDSAYLLSYSLGNGLFECYFAIKNLQSLHLSGNGLTGTLPSSLSINSNLTDLVLSHNKLSGTIPSVIQEKTWTTLDLSYNKFVGSLIHNISTYKKGSSLSLRNNRLSGVIPSSLDSTRDISILEANLFSCNLLQTNLPRHDSEKSTYSCGSNEFNVPYYCFLAVTGCASAIVLYAVLMVHNGNTAVDDTKSIIRQLGAAMTEYGGNIHFSKYSNLLMMHEMFGNVRKLVGILGVYIVVVCGSCYAVLSSLFGTYENQYAWLFSAGYMSGYIACIVIMVLLVTLLGFVVKTFRLFNYYQLIKMGIDTSNETVTDISDQTASNNQSSHVLVWTTIFMLNAAIVVGVNIGFIVGAIYGDQRTLFLLQFCLAIFKYLWNTVGLRRIMRWMSVRNRIVSSVRMMLRMELFIALWNTVVVPCCVVAAIDSSCFYNLFVQAEDVKSSYQYSTTCYVLRLGSNGTGYYCAQALAFIGTTQFSAPFTYSYQCGAAFITYYSAPFTYMCLIICFGVPAVEFFGLYIYKTFHGPEDAVATATTASRRCWSTAISSIVFVITKVTPRILIASSHSVSWNKTVSSETRQQPLVDAQSFMVSQMTLLCMLLTFGVMFPPLGAAIVATIWISSYYMQIKLGRFAARISTNAAELNGSIMAILNDNCTPFSVLARHSGDVLWALVSLSSWFYALILFDTLGDTVGVGGAYWVLIVMGVLPGVLYVSCLVLDRRLQSAVWRNMSFNTAGMALRENLLLKNSGDNVSGVTAVVPRIMHDDVELCT